MENLEIISHYKGMGKINKCLIALLFIIGIIVLIVAMTIEPKNIVATESAINKNSDIGLNIILGVLSSAILAFSITLVIMGCLNKTNKIYVYTDKITVLFRRRNLEFNYKELEYFRLCSMKDTIELKGNNINFKIKMAFMTDVEKIVSIVSKKILK